jgi:hypothetical protein
VQANDADYEFEVTCSYCEVYNELIFDLLIPNSGPLYLRYRTLLLGLVGGATLCPAAVWPPPHRSGSWQVVWRCKRG